MATKKRIPREAKLPLPLFPQFNLGYQEARRLLSGVDQSESRPIGSEQAKQLIELLGMSCRHRRAPGLLCKIVRAAETYQKRKFFQDHSRRQLWNKEQWKTLKSALKHAKQLHRDLKSLNPRTKRLVLTVRLWPKNGEQDLVEEVKRVRDRLTMIVGGVDKPEKGSGGNKKDEAAQELSEALVSIWRSAGNSRVDRSEKRGSYLHFAETVSETFRLDIKPSRLKSYIRNRVGTHNQ